MCEGPYSRTDIGGIPNYYDRPIKALQELGCPIDVAMFADLREAEKKLTERPPDRGDSTEHEVAPGISFTITMSMGPAKKDGFEHLRDVVTRYRRAWMAEHLEHYLQARWEQDLRAVGDAYHRHVADKAKAPTLRQFAKLANTAADNWFGGDLAGVANALSLPAPEPQTYARLLPADRAAFVVRVGTLLGGKPWGAAPQDMDRDQQTMRLRRWELAEHGPLAVQIWEATGEPPLLKSCGWARGRLETAFGDDTAAGWAQYIDAIQTALQASESKEADPSPSPAHRGERPVPAMTPDKRDDDQDLPPRSDSPDAPRRRGLRGVLDRLRD